MTKVTARRTWADRANGRCVKTLLRKHRITRRMENNLACPSELLPEGSIVKFMFVTPTGPVLGTAGMFPAVFWTQQPFQFTEIQEADQRRLHAAIQSSPKAGHGTERAQCSGSARHPLLIGRAGIWICASMGNPPRWPWRAFGRRERSVLCKAASVIVCDTDDASVLYFGPATDSARPLVGSRLRLCDSRATRCGRWRSRPVHRLSGGSRLRRCRLQATSFA